MSLYPLVIIPIGLFVLKILSLFLFPDVDGMEVKLQPLKAHELISVFGKGRTPYYPIMEEGEPYGNRTKRGSNWTGINNVPNPTFRNENKGTRYPRSEIYFKTAESEGKTIHVNQKPIALLQYLIRTYTKEGDTVLDFASGSMSTAIACIYTHRKCICIEKDETHFSQGEKRVRNEYQYLRLLVDMNRFAFRFRCFEV